MTQNIPTDYVADPAGRPTQYPTARTPAVVPVVGTSTGYTTYLMQGGYPDTAESAQAYARGQRAAARANEGRNGVTVDTAARDDMTAPPGTGPAQPVAVVGPQPYNRR